MAAAEENDDGNEDENRFRTSLDPFERGPEFTETR